MVPVSLEVLRLRGTTALVRELSVPGRVVRGLRNQPAVSQRVAWRRELGWALASLRPAGSDLVQRLVQRLVQMPAQAFLRAGLGTVLWPLESQQRTSCPRARTD